MVTDSVNRRPIGRSDGDNAQIRIENLRKTFDDGTVIACEDIDLDIANDEFVVLLGPSGCGKTTTLRCISGLEQPDSGQVSIQSEDVTYDKPKDRDLAFVFQSIALFPHMTVRENIRFGLDMKTDLTKSEKNERVDEIADMLNIPELLDRKPSALSGGQQQRVSLGRAMVMEPAAFLLDEPFSALDAQLRAQMRTEVKRLQRELKTAMIFVTHDQEEAMTLGDKIVVMNDGHIQQVGSPYEIYNDPENLFVANFIGSPSVNMIENEVMRSESDGQLYLTNSLFDYPLTQDRIDRETINLGDKLTLTIRPERVREEEDQDERLFEADVELIEPHSDRVAVYLNAGGVELTALLHQREVNEKAERIGVGFDEDSVWIFDDEGARVI